MASYTYSPYSSTANGESVIGTPGTGLTAFSPDDPRIPRTVSRSPGELMKEGQHDPFVSTSNGRIGLGLSATASSFRPVSRVVAVASPVSASISTPLPGTTQHLNHLIANSASPHAREVVEGVRYGTFTTDTGATRCIKVYSIYDKIVMPAVQASLDTLQKSYKIVGTHRYDNHGNVVRMRLSNITDAAAVYTAIRKDHMDLAVEYIPLTEFTQYASPGAPKSSAHEGQIMFSVRYPAGSPRVEFEEGMRSLLTVEGPLCAWKRLSAPGSEIFQMVAEFADATMAPRAVTRTNEMVTSGQLGMLMPTVVLHTPDTVHSRRHTPEATPTRQSSQYDLGDEFSRLDLSTPRSQGYVSSMTPHHGSIARMSGASFSMGSQHLYGPHPPYVGAMSPFSPTAGFSPFARGPAPFSPIGHQHGFDRHFHPMSPTYSISPYSPYTYGRGFSRPSPGRHYNSDREYSPRGGMTHRRRRSSNPAAGQHNQVDPERINAGTDVRTTVMLRNIPNKVNQAELKEIVDSSSFGKYDFMYLRIDFSNDCNVGYAFINFADPLDIIPFVKARSGEKWIKFRSDKIAEVSYATIQGRDCLIQKFRNSSVMLEPAHYRPKLFYTLGDSSGRAGEEEIFPASDNASKLKRSCENAEHVGLFAPSAGQHLRDEQRRRRSQYDRGTSLAEREDFEYDDGHHGYDARPRYIGYN